MPQFFLPYHDHRGVSKALWRLVAHSLGILSFLAILYGVIAGRGFFGMPFGEAGLRLPLWIALCIGVGRDCRDLVLAANLRNRLAAIGLTITLGLWVFYLQWFAWIVAASGFHIVFLSPLQIFHSMQVIANSGTWTLNLFSFATEPASKSTVWVVWIGEGIGILLSGAVGAYVAFVREPVYCQSCGSKANRERKVVLRVKDETSRGVCPPFDGSNPNQIFEPVPRGTEFAKGVRFTFYSCTKCRSRPVMRVENVKGATARAVGGLIYVDEALVEELEKIADRVVI